MSQDKFVMDCSLTMVLLLADAHKKELEKIEALMMDSRAFVPSV